MGTSNTRMPRPKRRASSTKRRVSTICNLDRKIVAKTASANLTAFQIFSRGLDSVPDIRFVFELCSYCSQIGEDHRLPTYPHGAYRRVEPLSDAYSGSFSLRHALHR